MARLGVAVIGGGPWGRALAAAAGRTGETLLLTRRDIEPLPNVTHVRTMAELSGRARLIVLATPSDVARDVARSLGDVIDGRHYVVHGVRGLVGDAMHSISDVVREETAARRLGALGGPVLAEELMAGEPSVMVAGSAFPEVTQALRDAFASPSLRLYTTTDLRGLEWASALVGCLAIGVGYLQGLGLRPGFVSAATTRAVVEAARIAVSAGGEERTMFGLGGYGDLLAAMTQKERPEVLLGAAIARNVGIEDAIREAKLRVEAVELIPRIVSWAEQRGVRAPIFSALARAVLTSPNHESIMHDLMTAPIHGAA
jgi:glycerol-3-phosphate dehydrogenase (NAD(P)+)